MILKPKLIFDSAEHGTLYAFCERDEVEIPNYPHCQHCHRKLLSSDFMWAPCDWESATLWRQDSVQLTFLLLVLPDALILIGLKASFHKDQVNCSQFLHLANQGHRSTYIGWKSLHPSCVTYSGLELQYLFLASFKCNLFSFIQT